MKINDFLSPPGVPIFARDAFRVSPRTRAQRLLRHRDIIDVVEDVLDPIEYAWQSQLKEDVHVIIKEE